MKMAKIARTSAEVAERQRLREAIVEIVSDSGEGAQKAGQIFGTVCAKMGNGVWTVEIIPAEIKPPARSRAGASGIRVRFGDRKVTNLGNEADLVVAFNEQVLFGRIDQEAYREGTVILLENRWAEDSQEEIRAQYAEALASFQERGFRVLEVPLQAAFAEVATNARVGKNMFVLGLLCQIFNRDLDKALDEVRAVFGRKGEKVVAANQDFVRAGWKFSAEHLEQHDLHFEIPPRPTREDLVVMNGNQAAGLGIMAAGIEVVAMYPITPATSVSHFLAAAFGAVGGIVHQAEDELAAIGFALGASYAGKTACTITSGPGLALKTEFIGLAVMAELPLVVLLVQRGGPSTGLPTKVEQADLLAVLHGSPGDAPKVVLAPATIEECFHFMVLARRFAEDFRTPVFVLTDANLATGVQPFPRPRPTAEWLSPPVDQSPWPEGLQPYDWDPETGLSRRPVPGQRGGEYVLTGLAHTRFGKVAYDPESNQQACTLRSRKLATLASTLKPPAIHGDPEGDLLVVGWGSTLGAIEEAVDALRAEGHRVSALHLRFLSPLEPGLGEIFARFAQVMTLEMNYSDPVVDSDPGVGAGDFRTGGENRRTGQLAQILRERTLIDVGCWSVVHGQPIPPRAIVQELKRRLPDLPAATRKEAACSA
jgi:2-oxoglutarate/2-oxoacid ferredoxin oxidoreductase subunit alpha